MPKVKGLRRRWLLNTAGAVCALGLACVLVITMVFAAYYYSTMESDLRLQAETTCEFLSSNPAGDVNTYYQSCITYVETFDQRNNLELQFLDLNGVVIASSYGLLPEQLPDTKDVEKALQTGEAEKFVGRDSLSRERIMAISSPVVYLNGEVVGLLRYITSTHSIDVRIATIACIAFLALLVVVGIVLISSSYYLRYTLDSLNLITEKAKMITNGSYGIQIQTKYDDEIGELAQTINEMSMQINRNEKTQTEFISSLSHELRTPLTAITGWSETLLSSDELDESTRRGVKIILGEGKRLTEMVLELLDFTRIQDGRMTLNMEVTDLRAEFEDTVFMYGSRLTQDGIELEYYENDQEIPEISCDPKRLRQVFLNILDNAAKHGRDGKKIDTDISCDEENVIVRIRDYGQGIPEDELSLVKRKFYKGSSKARGSGIGLAVCDEILQMHGGSLTLENAPGGGTLVTVKVPVTQ